MSRTFPFDASRRGALLLAAGAALVGGSALAAPRMRIVTILGDSITAGLGLPAGAALPAQLEAALGGPAAGVRVRGAGVSGDTAADGLARVDFSVQKDTDVCVVALGGNDLLQGGDPRRMKDSLTKIIRRLKARGMTVVLAGMVAPPVIGQAYAREFNAVFPALAKAEGVFFLPDLLRGVAMDSRYNQRDGIHPSAQGVKRVTARLAPVVAQALKSRR